MRLLILLCAFASLCGCACCDKEKQENQASATNNKVQEEAIPGGYIAQDPQSAEMQAIAKEVTALFQKEHPDYRLLKVHKAATQVVSGTNYFLRLEFQTDKENVFWEFTVYESLPPERKLEISEQKQLD